MRLRARKKIPAFMLMAIVMMSSAVSPQSVEELDRRAGELYRNKEFTRALGEWLRILEIEPDNENIQKKIEMLYEEKHRKDLAYQKARFHFRLARQEIPTDVQKAKEDSDVAINNFVTAYRIDPTDPDLQAMREEMRRLQDEVRIELAKKRLSEELKQRYIALMEDSAARMKSMEFEKALANYKEVLRFVPNDTAALEGLRNAEMAISNRLKYEKIQLLLAGGIVLFGEKKYKEARNDFEEALALDIKNREAKKYIDRIDELLESNRNMELKRIQAEQFYLSGIENIRNKNFDQAADDFKNALSLIKDYKDVRARLDGLDRLRKEYAEEQRLLRLRNIDREFQNGLLAYSEGRYREALSHLEKTLALDAGNELAKKYIGMVKEAIRDIEEEVVDVDSPYYSIVNPLIISGKQLYDRGNYIESRKRWDEILRLFPKNRVSLEYLLKCELALNPAAFQDFAQKIVEEGKGLLDGGKYAKALTKFELIRSISADYPEINELIAQAKRGTERAAPAGVNQQDIEARYALGMELYQRGGKANIEAALANFRWVVANNPNHARSLIAMNRIESQLRYGGGEAAPERAGLTEKQKELVRTYYYNGINYYTNNNFDRAIEEWRKVLVIDPTHEKARNNIRKSLVLLGR
ncbi:MAG: Tetratricopeptide repeat protein [Spirochaetes bacterium ADurb.BinA120]|nr:MAG: Tetratricopeptide repeat protein [Spirochaetes bacterium ADurb.BinA120]